MATTFTGLRVQDTYNAIIKIGDNSTLTGTGKLLSDGYGNSSNLYLSTTRLGIGVVPTENLHIGGSMRLTGSFKDKNNESGTTGQVLTSTATGTDWKTISDIDGVTSTTGGTANYVPIFTSARNIENSIIQASATLVTISGNLDVNGTVTYIDTIDLSVKDPLIKLANANVSNTLDVGFYGKYVVSATTKYLGLYSDASDSNKFRLFTGLETEPTTVVDSSDTTFAVGTLIANLEGNVTGGTISGTRGDFTPSVNIDGGTGYGRIEIGGDSGGYIDLKAPYSDDYDLRLITSSGGSEVTSASTLNLSSASGQINLKPGNAEIHLIHSGTTFGKLFTSGNDFFINNPTQNEDIIFSGNDGGNAVTALILDMSENGEATFSGNIGIGITPGQKLHSYISTGDIYNLIETGSNVSTAGSRYKSSSKEYFAGLQYSVSSAYQIYDITEGEARMTIDTAGATTFYKDVTISNSTTHSYLSIDAANVSASEAGMFLKIGGTTKWEIYTAANDGNFNIYSQTQGIKLFITPTGDTSFAGTITATKDSQAQGIFQGWSTSGANGSSGAIRLGGNSSYQGRIDYAADGNTQFLFNNTFAAGIYKFAIAGTPKLEINSSNINIATPITNAFFGINLQYDNTDTVDFKVNQSTGQIKIGGSQLGYYPTFYSAGVERLRIDTSGVSSFYGNINIPSSSNSYKINGYQLAKYSYFGYSTGYPGIVIGNTGGQSLFFNVDPVGNGSGSFTGDGREYVYRNVGSFITPNALNDGYNTILGWNTSGGVTFSNGTTFNGDVTITGNLFLPTASSYIKLGGYSFIGEDLIDQDSLTIASHYSESIYFAHENAGVYTTTVRIDPSGKLGIGTGTSAIGQKLEVKVASGDGILINSADVATFKMKGGGSNNWGLASTNLLNGDFGIYKSNATSGDPISAGTPSLYFLPRTNNMTQIGAGSSGADVEGRFDIRMNFTGQNWVPNNTSAKWSEVWCSSGTPGSYFNDVMLHLNTNRGGGATGGVVGIAFSPGWGGHQNWGIYSFNTDGSNSTSGDLAFVSQLNDGTRIERMRLDGPTGHVGIGNFLNTPQAKLHVDSGSLYVNAIQSDSKLTGSVSNETSANLYGSDGYWGIRTALNNSINFDTYNSASPVTPLTIFQTGSVYIHGENNGYDGTLRVGQRAYFQHRDAGNTTTSIISDYPSDSAVINFRMKGVSDANAQMTIKGSGNVGINNASPAKKLEISSGTDGDGILLTGTGGFGTGTSRNIEFSYNDTDTSYASAIKFEVPNSAVHGGQVSIWTDNTVGTSTRAMTISNAQSVGINTTSIKGKLDVYRAAGQSGTAAIAITNGEGGGGRNWGISTEVVRSGDFAILQSTTNGGVPTPSSANTKLYIHPSGYVGIQTTLPTAPLQIHSTNSGQPTIPVFLVNESISLNTEVRLGFAANTNNDVASNRYSYISTINTTGSNGQAMVFATNESGSSAVQRMYIKSSGNVGVNTSNPSAKLHTVDDGYSLKTSRTTGASENLLIGNKAAAGIIGTTYPGQIQSYGNNIFEIYTEGAQPLVLGTASTHRIYISGAGRVGLGTTNPSTLLSLQSTLNSSLGGISLIGNSPGDKSNIWTQDIYSKWLHTENTADANNGYGRIDFATNAAVNATYPTRGGFSFTTTGAGQFVTFTNQGRVGINITTPSERLSIKGADQSVEEILRVRTANTSYPNAGASLGVSGYEGEMCVYDSANVKRIYLSSHYNCYINPKGPGFTAIGKTSASYTLDVSGTIRATADVIAYSDKRVKENIITIDNALEKVTKLRGVTYTRKDIEDKSTKIGVIAQEVLEVLPEVVSKDDEGKYSVAYGNMAGVFIEAIKELENRIKELENKSCNCKCK